MKTGIYRRIDDLGRIVIPKEVRRSLHIDEGDMLEISTENRRIVLTPYTPMTDASFVIDNCIKAFNNQSSEVQAVVTTKHDIFASQNKVIRSNSSLSVEMKSLIGCNMEFMSDSKNGIPIVGGSQQKVIAAFPIKKYGELYGFLAFICDKDMIPAKYTMEKGRLMAEIIGLAVSD